MFWNQQLQVLVWKSDNYYALGRVKALGKIICMAFIKATYFLFLSKTFSKTSNINRLKLSYTPAHIHAVKAHYTLLQDTGEEGTSMSSSLSW
jgi:hypothetical protein